jgi:hypothetical protein
MTMANVDVQRLARALGEFWYDGGGPSTHDELGYAFEDASLDRFDAELMRSYEGSKRDRVNRAVRLAAEHGRLWPLVERLVSSLHDAGMLDDEQSPDHQQRATRLRRSLGAMGRGISGGGTLTGSVSPAVAEEPATLLGIPVARDHIERLRDAVRREDVANMVGISKELVESVVHIVLRDREVEVDDDWDLVKLAKEAQKALLLHGSVQDVEDDYIGQRVKRILSSLSNIVSAVIELRNEMGTGHGRPEPPSGIKTRHAKMTAGAAIVYSEMMLDTLQDPDATWTSTST